MIFRKKCSSNDNEIESSNSKWKPYIPIIISTLFLLAGILLRKNISATMQIIPFCVAYLIVAYKTLWKAIIGIPKGDIFNEHFLMSIATIGAFLIGAYSEGVAVMLFYEVGELFQNAAVNRAKNSIKALLDIRPDRATVIRNGRTTSVSPQFIQVGEIIQIKLGEKVAMDGLLISERASFDTAALTGESKPDSKYKGEQVLAGMINLSTVVEIKVNASFQDSKLSKILQMVQDATERKAKTQLFISKFAKVYTPIVVFCAIGIAFIPYLFVSNYVFDDWVYRALVFLVASCPCALVISIPLGYFGGIGAASKNGILFKGSNYLDLMKEIDTVVLDKTGTLTKGTFKVQKVTVVENFDEKRFIKLVAALESKSTHPIALAIVEYEGKSIKNSHIQEVKEIVGHGLKGRVDGFEILAGNSRLLKKFNISYNPELDNIPETVVMVAINGEYKGLIIIADELKEDAIETLHLLHQLQLKIVMLSGDKNAVTQKVANTLGIDEAFGSLLPEDKVSKVEELKSQKRKIAFVGDGVNDAPVLALADVGIAMGGLGSDVAIETADVVIQTDQPSKIPIAIKIAKNTSHIVWQNIAFAMGVKLIILVLGAGGLATIWEAVFADVGVALLAILNAMRIQRMKFVLIAFTVCSLLFSNHSIAQQAVIPPISLEEAIKIALQNNPQLKGAAYKVDQQQALQKTAFDLGKTQINYTRGQPNSIVNSDNNITLSQSFEFPTIMLAQSRLQKEKTHLAKQSRTLTEKELVREVKAAYYQLVFGLKRSALLKQQDSIYQNFVKLADLRYKTGETNNLERLTAQGKSHEVMLQQQQAATDVAVYLQQLQQWLGVTQPVSIVSEAPTLNLLANNMDVASLEHNPLLTYSQQQIKVAKASKSIEKNRLLPDISLGYFSQTLIGFQNVNGTEQYFGPDKRFTGFSVGLALPLWFRPQQGKIQAATMENKIAQAEYENTRNILRSSFNQLLQQYKQARTSFDYYQQQGLEQAEIQLQTAEKSYRAGEIGYVEYLQGITQAIGIKEQHLTASNRLNQIIIQINFISGGN